MLILTMINQYACLRILCDVFPEVTMKEYLYKILIPCAGLGLATIVLPATITLLVPSSSLRILLTFGATMIGIGVSIIFYLDKGEKVLVKTIFSHLFVRSH